MKGKISVIEFKCSKEVLLDIERIKSLLKHIVSAIGMTVYCEPVVIEYTGDTVAAGSHTIIQPLVESFIAYDDWPNLEYAHVVIDSCKPFDIENAIKVIKDRIPECNITKVHDGMIMLDIE